MPSISSLAERDASIARAYTQAGIQVARAWVQADGEPTASGKKGFDPGSGLRRLIGVCWEGSWWLRGALARGIELAAGFISAGVHAVENVFGWSLSVVALPLLAFLQIPYLGRALHWALSITLALLWLILKLPDGLLALVGVLPEKTLRVGFINLAEGQPALDDLEGAIINAGVVLRGQANIRLVVTGKEGAVDWSRSWVDLRASEIAVHPESGHGPVEVGCLWTAFAEDLSRKGSTFGKAIVRGDRFGMWRRLVGAGSPLSVLLVDKVHGGQLLGCSLGPLVDYVTVNAGDPRCLAHELGHACNLWHVGERSNLMHHHCGGGRLSRWQVSLLRMSRHVAYV